MGCWAAYLVRLEDGSSWELDEKFGRWHLTGADDRDRLVDRVLADGRRVEGAPHTARSCQGIALDLATRRYRFYSCALNVPRAGASHRESMAHSRAATPDWKGWSVAYAWGGDEELRHLLFPGLPPEPARGESVAGAGAGASDGAVDMHLAAEDAVTDGAVIDLRTRHLRYWTADAVPPWRVAGVRAAWPGWTVERLPWGHLAHLAAVGQRSGDLSMTDAELREARWEDELITTRNHARAALPTEPRRLFPPEVRVVDRW